MDNIQIDLVTVLIAAALNMVIMYVWYSKWMFGPLWAKLARSRESNSVDKLTMVYFIVNSIVIAYFLGFFEAYLSVTSVTDGMFVGFCAWLGFVATTQISGVLMGNVPFKLFLVETGAKLLTFLVMSGVIGA